MHRPKLFFFIVLFTLAVFAITIAIIWRASIFAVLPSSAQNFLESNVTASSQALRETFGMSVAEDVGSGTVEEVALGDDVSDSSNNNIATSNDGNVESAQGVAQTQTPAPMRPIASVDSPVSLDDIDTLIDDASTNASTGTQAITTITPTTPTPSCSFPSSPLATSSLSQKIIFNEVAWMGTTVAANQEWMELKNISSNDVDLSGWAITNASGKMKMDFGADDRIVAGGFLLLMRGSTTLPYSHASQISYSGDLRNAGDDLVLFDPACNASDFVAALAAGWSAGNNTTKQTMERDAGGMGWHSSVNVGGTPGVENSVVLPPAQYKVNIMFEGSSGAIITSDPVGVVCMVTQCTGTFVEKTKVAFTEQPAAGAIFDGWSGACSGKGKCSFTVTGDTSLTASFHVPIIVAFNPPSSNTDSSSDVDSDPGSEVASTPTSTPTSSPSGSASTAGGHILIAAVQIAGVASTNDFVKLYNPSSVAVDMGGWKLRKKSQTGADYSLRTIPADMTIGPGGYFMWANSADGFSASIGADVSSTETLAGNNSVALTDADGNLEDALAWGTGTDQYGKGAPYPDDPVAGQVLTRKMVDGVPTDTGNNADDFALQ
jgi:hypothetical protein